LSITEEVEVRNAQTLANTVTERWNLPPKEVSDWMREVGKDTMANGARVHTGRQCTMIPVINNAMEFVFTISPFFPAIARDLAQTVKIDLWATSFPNPILYRDHPLDLPYSSIAVGFILRLEMWDGTAKFHHPCKTKISSRQHSLRTEIPAKALAEAVALGQIVLQTKGETQTMMLQKENNV